MKNLMRFAFTFCFLAWSYALFGQYNYFDFELEYDSYKSVHSSFMQERINGRVKEIKRYSDSSVYLHVELNKNNQIIKEHEYIDTLLSRTKIYANQKIIKETEYHRGMPSKQILYKYDRSGRLIAKDFVTKKRVTTRIKYQYDSAGRLLTRNYNKKRHEKFIYDGDTVVWKLVINENSVLLGVTKKIRTEKEELIIRYKLDTLNSAHFTQRIKPTSEFRKKWDTNHNTIETAEFEYDNTGNRVLKSLQVNEFNSNKLTKTISTHNTNQLKGQSITEFQYNDRGLLESEISKHDNYVNERKYEYDEHGNCTFQGVFNYRFIYDKNGNWTTKQRLNKMNSSFTEIRNGVTETRKYNEDIWINEERRLILYFD